MGNVIDELEGDYEIVVICINPDDALPINDTYRNCKIFRISLPRFKISDFLMRYKPLRPAAQQLHRIMSVLSIVLSPVSINAKLQKAYEQVLCQISDIDLLIPSQGPMEAILAALNYKITKKPNVQIIPFLFDAFAQSDTLHRFRWNKMLKRMAHIRIEQNILEFSNYVCFVPSWQKHLNEIGKSYVNKMMPIEHPLLKIEQENEQSTAPVFFQKDKIHILYAGSLNNKFRPVGYTLKLIKEIVKEFPDTVFHFMGSGNEMKKVIRGARQMPNNIIYHGAVTNQNAYHAMKFADILLSIGATNTPQLSSKIIEYFAYGKPVIHLNCKEDDSAIPLLEQYPLACSLMQKDEYLIENSRKLILFTKENHKKIIPFDVVQNRLANALPNFSAKIIRNILK